MGLSKAGKWLLAWSAAFIVLAEIIKQVGLGKSAAMAVGLVELLLAIATGIVFGLLTAKSDA